MNNKYTSFLVVGVFIYTILYSCKKDTIEFTNATMKPWFDEKCSSCHSSGKSNAGDWLYDPTDYTKSILDKKTKLYEVIYQKKNMPPTGSTQAELDKFKTWYDDGCPAN